MNQQKGFGQGHAQPVDEFQRCGTGTTFTTIHHNKIRFLAGCQHGFDDGKPFPWMADRELEAHRFAAGEFPQLVQEFQQLNRVGKGGMAGR